MHNAKWVNVIRNIMKNYGLGNSVKALTFFETVDYNLFVITSINRTPIQAHVNALAESIKRIGLLRPINVVRLGNKYHILDGGHRFEACKIAKASIKFIVNSIVATQEELVNVLAELNRSYRFRDKDYVNGYASAGNQNYINYETFHETYPDFSCGGIQQILTVDGGGTSSKLFRSGKFICGELVTAYRFADDLMAMKQNNPREYCNVKFIQALSSIWTNPLYSHKTFLHSLKKPKFKRIFDGIYNITVFKSVILDVYNDNLPMNKRIY